MLVATVFVFAAVIYVNQISVRNRRVGLRHCRVGRRGEGEILLVRGGKQKGVLLVILLCGKGKIFLLRDGR